MGRGWWYKTLWTSFGERSNFPRIWFRDLKFRTWCLEIKHLETHNFVWQGCFFFQYYLAYTVFNIVPCNNLQGAVVQFCSQSNQEHRGEPLFFSTSALGSTCVTQHTGPTALRPVHWTNKLMIVCSVGPVLARPCRLGGHVALTPSLWRVGLTTVAPISESDPHCLEHLGKYCLCVYICFSLHKRKKENQSQVSI